jgi:hypothetical protein
MNENRQSKPSKINSPHYGIPGFDPEARLSQKDHGSQLTFWTEEQLIKVLDSSLTTISEIEAKTPVVGRRDSRKRGWDTLTFNKGTRDEIPMRGRYYTITSYRKKPLDIWSSPPETRDAVLLANVIGVRAFVLKDSEASSDPLKRGWAEVIILEITPEGEKPKIKKFSDGRRDFVVCRARFSDIKSKGKS